VKKFTIYAHVLVWYICIILVSQPLYFWRNRFLNEGGFDKLTSCACKIYVHPKKLLNINWTMTLTLSSSGNTNVRKPA